MTDPALLDRTGDPRRARWERLALLLDRVEGRGVAALRSADARELAQLYSRVSSDLLEELRRDEDGAVAEYLRRLVGRAHGLLERGTPPRVGEAILRFFARDFPETVRRRVRPLLLAALVFLVGSGFGAATFASDPGTGEVLLPFGHRTLDPTERVREEEQAMTTGSLPGRAAGGALFAGMLFQNNTKVTYFCFALAVTGGIGTALLLFANGAYLGAVCVKYVAAGQSVFLAAWILPHAVLEIPAILLGAAAAFALVRAIFAPGLAGRRAALSEAGRDVLRLLLGATATLAVAGLIEGTLSQMHSPVLYPWKIVFGVVVACAYAGYLFLWSPELLARHRRGHRP